MKASIRPNATFSEGFVTRPQAARRAVDGETSVVCIRGDEAASSARDVDVEDRPGRQREISGLSYAVAAQLTASGPRSHMTDVYPFANGDVALSVVQIGGTGGANASGAAVQATLLKYGLRAYGSYGLRPESVVRNVDRLLLESCTFERRQSFANVFFGVLDRSRRYLTYACAAHDSIVVVHANGQNVELAVTAPLIGVFDDQHHLFRQGVVQLAAGSLIVISPRDAVMVRDAAGEVFGSERLSRSVASHRRESEHAIANAVLAEVDDFARPGKRADRTVLVVRVH